MVKITETAAPKNDETFYSSQYSKLAQGASKKLGGKFTANDVKSFFESGSGKIGDRLSRQLIRFIGDTEEAEDIFTTWLGGKPRRKAPENDIYVKLLDYMNQNGFLAVFSQAKANAFAEIIHLNLPVKNTLSVLDIILTEL